MPTNFSCAITGVAGWVPEKKLTNFDLTKMRNSIGAGIRFISPFGPLGFAYGIKLDQNSGESTGEFHFSAGSAF